MNEFKKLQCELCGGQLVMDNTGDFATCEYCGMKFTRERMNIVFSSSVKIENTVHVSGVETIEKWLEDAGTYMKMGERTRAMRILHEAIEKYPSDSRGYWAMAKLFLEVMGEDSVVVESDIWNMLKEHYDKAMLVAKEEKNALCAEFAEIIIWLLFRPITFSSNLRAYKKRFYGENNTIDEQVDRWLEIGEKQAKTLMTRYIRKCAARVIDDLKGKQMIDMVRNNTITWARQNVVECSSDIYLTEIHVEEYIAEMGGIRE